MDVIKQYMQYAWAEEIVFIYLYPFIYPSATEMHEKYEKECLVEFERNYRWRKPHIRK